MAKTKLIVKRTERKRKFIKDKAIINFLLEHMKPVKIDFSKIRFPSFSYFQEKEEKNNSDLNKLFLNKKSDNFKILGSSSINFVHDEQ